MSARLMRGLSALATALTVAAGCLLSAAVPAAPARAAPATSMPVVATPDLASEWWLTTVLRDGAFGAGIVIAVLAGALLLARLRRRQARARARSAQASGRHTGGFLAVTGGFSVLRSHGAHAARKGSSAADGTSTTGGQHATGPPRARPRMTPVPRSGTLGSMGRPAIRTRATSDAPPWAPARLPEVPGALALPPADAGDPALQQPEVAQPGVPDATIPLWERVTGPQLAAAPLSADVPTWPKVNTGPMYVWNPATNSGPFPAANHDPGHRPGSDSAQDLPSAW